MGTYKGSCSNIGSSICIQSQHWFRFRIQYRTAFRKNQFLGILKKIVVMESNRERHFFGRVGHQTQGRNIRKVFGKIQCSHVVWNKKSCVMNSNE